MTFSKTPFVSVGLRRNFPNKKSWVLDLDDVGMEKPRWRLMQTPIVLVLDFHFVLPIPRTSIVGTWTWEGRPKDRQWPEKNTCKTIEARSLSVWSEKGKTLKLENMRVGASWQLVLVESLGFSDVFWFDCRSKKTKLKWQHDGLWDPRAMFSTKPQLTFPWVSSFIVWVAQALTTQRFTISMTFVLNHEHQIQELSPLGSTGGGCNVFFFMFNLLINFSGSDNKW